MDDKRALLAPSTPPGNQSFSAKYPRLFYGAQIFNSVFILTVLAVHWYRNRQREIPLPTISTSPQEDQNEVQNITADFHVPRIPYNEDTIVTIISDIYRVYLQLNYISDWEVVWAPEEGHAINQALCEELRINPVVISLMKRLPYLRFSGIAADIEFIYPYSRAFVYLEDYEIRGGRDPDRFIYEKPRPDVLLPQEIALTCSLDEGIHVILDTKESNYTFQSCWSELLLTFLTDTIRVWSFNEPPPGDDNENYRNYYPHHAPTYLASYLQQVRSLEIIPSVERYTRKLYNKHYPDIVGHSFLLRPGKF